MTDKIKNQRGITLIALIVTIIVLIILAAVGISMLLGENGITEKARWSKSVTEFERIDEETKLHITEKQINEYGKVPKGIQKFSFQSLFTSISYASDSAKTNDTIYPIIQGDDGKVDKDRVEYTLQKTIKNLELPGKPGRWNNQKYVDLRKVDLKLLGETEVKRDYVINIAEKGKGELYWLNQVSYQGLAWHTPRAKNGVDEDAEESDYVIHYLTGNEKEEVIRNIPNGSSEIQLESINDLGITQEGKFFLHWKDVTNESEYKEDDEDEEEEEETTGNEGKTYEDGDKINLETDWWLQNRNIYLKAVWQDGVILNANGEGAKIDGEQSITIRVIEGKEYGAELDKEPTRTGYTFDGWYTEKEEGRGIKKTNEHEYDPSELTNSTLYAHWVDDIDPEPFTISVSDLTEEGFTMNLSRVEDLGSGVNEEDGVTYYVSDENPTLDTVNASSQSENTVTGLSDGTTKYVWAEITDRVTNTRRSSNYVRVQTDHTHSDFEGECYEDGTPSRYSIKRSSTKASGCTKGTLRCNVSGCSAPSMSTVCTYVNLNTFKVDGGKTRWVAWHFRTDTTPVNHQCVGNLTLGTSTGTEYDYVCIGCGTCRGSYVLDSSTTQVSVLSCVHISRILSCGKTAGGLIDSKNF